MIFENASIGVYGSKYLFEPYTMWGILFHDSVFYIGGGGPVPGGPVPTGGVRFVFVPT